MSWYKQTGVGQVGPQGPQGPPGIGGILIEPPDVTNLSVTFDAVSTQGFLLPEIIYNCADFTGYSTPGAISVTFTPNFTGSGATIDNVALWVGYSDNSDIGWQTVDSSGTTTPITSGTRLTISANFSPPTGKTFLGIVPKFNMSVGNTNTNYKVKMTDVVVNINGVEVPKKAEINAGCISVYTASVNSVAVSKTSAYSPITRQSRWSSGRLCTYGDSITATSEGQASPLHPRYPGFLKQILSLNYLEDRSVSGFAVSNFGTTDALVNIVNKHQDFNLITIALGVNDYNFNTPLGTIGTKTDAKSSYNKGTFYGAYRYCLDSIFEVNPFACVVLIVPITKTVDNANSTGATLEDYRTAIHALGKMYNTPVFDPNFCFNTKTMPTFSYDGLHITDLGHRVYADYLSSFLSSI
jgi:lysophospholipase L1-like esterase